MSRKPRSKKKRRSTSVLGRRASAEWPSHLADRLASASEGLSCREIADSTGNNHENVRRYMKTGAPSLEFLRAFCEHFGVSADWLLFGRTAKGSQGSSGGPAASKKLRAAMDLLREADSFLGTASKARR